ncbi:trace amine-associated receptor 4-like protein [Lates japonicus]|uniref:Trace amine-associated receptor 4-like protein n=1 Tax=Lates japonicus TaxID=270547 RepID=A0AAD3RGW2_LATJO|nr:trace amine-associated receptor 4-like protein [Lates japonicus]
MSGEEINELYTDRAVVIQLSELSSFSLMMEKDELAPQLLNTSCKKPKPPDSVAVFIYILLFFISVLTAALNLLVIISISHYR